jgi:hypothetical protein
MKLLRSLTTAIALMFVFLLAGCVSPYRAEFDNAGKDKHWTKKQTLAAFAYADRIWWAREVQEGSNQYVIIYGKVPTTKVASQIETVLRDLDESLDPNNAEMVQYLDTFKLRADLTHEEQITKAQYARVHAADLENQFEQKMGDRPEYGPEAQMGGGYNIRKIFLTKDVSEAFPFKASQIEGAKADGSLKEIESLELEYTTPYDHKASDPKHPNDENEFVWKPAKMSIRLTNYKIVTEDKPQDNKGNYIEGYRVIDGKQESKPTLKIFFPSGGEGAVVLVDTDREGEAGFGVPDILQVASDIENVKDVINDGTLLATLFQEKKSEKRVLPPHNLFKIEISKVDQPVDQWEKSTDPNGWIVPFKYVTMMGDNYNVRIKFKHQKIDPSNPGYPNGDHEHSMFMEVEYIAKEYTKAGERYEASPGQVIEYYHPKGLFATKVQVKVLEEDSTKKLSFEFEDGDEVVGVVPSGSNKFIEDKPYAISYTEGSKRWWIQSSDGSKFDKRKQASPPKERTGEYDDSEMEEAQRGSAKTDDGGGMGMGRKPVVKIQREAQQAPPNSNQ